MKRRRVKIYLFLFWIWFIFVLLTIPTQEYVIEKITIYDKIIHMILFGVFNLLLLNVLSEFKKIKRYLMISIAIFSGVFYIFICEYIQNFIIGRSSSILDSIAGVIGIFITLIYWFKNRATDPDNKKI